MKRSIQAFIMLLFAASVSARQSSTLQDSLTRFFKEVKSATAAGKKIWGTDIYGHILLTDPVTRKVYANYPDKDGILKPDKGLYSGQLPVNVNIANTALDWAGNRWAMIMLPLPAVKADRINLLTHELFHKAQPSLGFDLFNKDNNHLDQKDGRIYLRLELQALQKAINATSKAAMKVYLTDALTFRKYRHLIYPDADSIENNLELKEGLAEYTGLIMSNRKQQEAMLHFNQGFTDFLSNPTFVSSFAYQTIPAYGYLLYHVKKDWNKKVTQKTNLADYFIKAFGITLNDNLKKTVTEITSQYNGDTIMAEETAREVNIKKLVAEYKQRFIEQPHFDIYFEQMNISYDPRNLMPVEDKGTVYPNIRITDKWGILTVTNGALLSSGWDKISVSIPTKNDGKNISGEGWTLSLNDGYRIIKEENNNYKMVK